MTDVLQFLTAWAITIEAWAIDHWPGVLVPVILLCGISLVCSATRLARWRSR